jgi:hypothetical protein
LPTFTPESYAEEEKQRIEEALKEQLLDEITIDVVAAGEQQPESDHGFEGENSNAGTISEKRWRSASGWFSYVLKDPKKEAIGIQVIYDGQQADNNFKIFINDQLLVEEGIIGKMEATSLVRTYDFTNNMRDENNGTFKIGFEAMKGSGTARILEVRLLRKSI